jgi:hypothetical protein
MNRNVWAMANSKKTVILCVPCSMVAALLQVLLFCLHWPSYHRTLPLSLNLLAQLLEQAAANNHSANIHSAHTTSMHLRFGNDASQSIISWEVHFTLSMSTPKAVASLLADISRKWLH